MPIVGRTSEIGRLVRMLDAASEGLPRIAWLKGPAGIGKTALLDELERLARVKGFTVARTRMTGPGLVEPYRPMVELVSTTASRTCGGPPVALVRGRIGSVILPMAGWASR